MINIRDEKDVQIWCDYQEETRQTNASFFLRLRFANFRTFVYNANNYNSRDYDVYGNLYGWGYFNGDGSGCGDGYDNGGGYGCGKGYGNGTGNGRGNGDVYSETS